DEDVAALVLGAGQGEYAVADLGGGGERGVVVAAGEPGAVDRRPGAGREGRRQVERHHAHERSGPIGNGSTGPRSNRIPVNTPVRSRPRGRDTVTRSASQPPSPIRGPAARGRSR